MHDIRVVIVKYLTISFILSTYVFGHYGYAVDIPKPSWKDSYAVNGTCYCDSNGYDHGIGDVSLEILIPKAEDGRAYQRIRKSIPEICSALGEGPSANRIPYNDIQCGNGPANDAGDEDTERCPGRVDIGPEGCQLIGPRWNLEPAFGTGAKLASDKLAISGFTLIDAETDAELLQLSPNGRYSFAGRSLAIRADVSRAVSKVTLTVSGPVNTALTEAVAPYASFGDRGGNYTGKVFVEGSYTVTATALVEGVWSERISLNWSIVPSVLRPGIDYISLHYDFAPDPDDVVSAVFDRALIETEKIPLDYVARVKGTVGTNARFYQLAQSRAMDKIWPTVLTLDAKNNFEHAVRSSKEKWIEILESGGDIWVKEGGQSDFTAEVVRQVLSAFGSRGLCLSPNCQNIGKRLHVIQHSHWNEDHTTANDLAYVKEFTDYRRIGDGNIGAGTADLAEENYAHWWKQAKQSNYGSLVAIAERFFADVLPDKADGSDTVILLHILGIGTDKVNDLWDMLREYLNVGPGPFEITAASELIVGLGGVANLRGTVPDSVDSTTWSKVSGPGTVQFGNASALETTATFSAPGRYSLQLKVETGDQVATDHVDLSVVNASDIVAAINGGSQAYTSVTGIDYTADRYYSGGWTDEFTGNDVNGTLDHELYNHARSGFTAYKVPVVNGDYTVLLQFSETHFNSDGQRVFDVGIEGVPVVTNLDLHSVSPGKFSAHDLSFDTHVSDGTLDLNFSASLNHPLLSAFVVVARNPIPLPGRVEAEYFDEGIPGIAYMDISNGNIGGAYRGSDVDIENSREGGYNVGWIAAGEWLTYTVTTPSPGYYGVSARVASAHSSEKSLRIEIDGNEVPEAITFNTQGAGWQAWQDVDGPSIWLDSGQHQLRVVMDSNALNLDYLNVKGPHVLTDLAINAGNGSAEGHFDIDRFYSGGTTYSTTSAIDLSQTSFPAPERVYQSERWSPSPLIYTFTDLIPNSYYLVRLHFAEIWANAPGQRQFNIDINERRVMTDYDIFADVGRNTAIVKEFSVQASSVGQVAINLKKGTVNNPKINGLELWVEQ